MLPVCEATLKRDLPTFSCHVGTAMRKQYAVAINEREVVITKYYGPNAMAAGQKLYRVVYVAAQRPGWLRHR